MSKKITAIIFIVVLISLSLYDLVLFSMGSLTISSIWIYRMTKLERMPYHRVGKLLKFNRDEINKWVLGNKSNFKTSEKQKS